VATKVGKIVARRLRGGFRAALFIWAYQGALLLITAILLNRMCGGRDAMRH
jgi:hypothetical protein